MDVLIPLGTGSKWKNNELRYCLRSLERHCKDLDRVIIVGERPEWLQNIEHIPMKDAYIPTLSIWTKTLEGSKHTNEFLFCNDDFFFMSDFTAKDYPNYYTDVTGNSPYKKILRRTMKVCEQSGLSALNYDVHKPMVINSAKFKKAYNFFEWHLGIDQGLVMKSCYANLAGVKGTWVQDVKLYRGAVIPAEGVFSISDEMIDHSFRLFCEGRWPNKSKYEL